MERKPWSAPRVILPTPGLMRQHSGLATTVEPSPVFDPPAFEIVMSERIRDWLEPLSLRHYGDRLRINETFGKSAFEARMRALDPDAFIQADPPFVMLSGSGNGLHVLRSVNETYGKLGASVQRAATYYDDFGKVTALARATLRKLLKRNRRIAAKHGGCGPHFNMRPSRGWRKHQRRIKASKRK